MNVPKVLLSLLVLCNRIDFHGCNILFGNHSDAVNVNYREDGVLIIANVKFDAIVAAVPDKQRVNHLCFVKPFKVCSCKIDGYGVFTANC